MVTRVVVTRAAAADITAARNWYRDRRPELGSDWLTEVDAALERVAARPEMYPIVLADIRRVLVRRFPYSLYYQLRNGTVRVIAVAHQRQHPQNWQRRAT